MMVMVIMVDNGGDGDNCVDERRFNVNEGKSDDDALLKVKHRQAVSYPAARQA